MSVPTASTRPLKPDRAAGFLKDINFCWNPPLTKSRSPKDYHDRAIHVYLKCDLLIGDVPAATAILERFLHHANLIKIKGISYRMVGGPLIWLFVVLMSAVMLVMALLSKIRLYM